MRTVARVGDHGRKESDLATGTHEKLIVRKPLYEDLPNEAPGEGVNTGVTETETFMSAAQVAGSPLHITWGIIHAVPPKNPYVVEHDHPYDEVLFFQGFDPENTLDLGAVFEVSIDGEVQVIDSTCAIFIPAGTKHCPLTVKSVTRPCGLAAICVSGRYQTMGYATPV